VKLVARAAVIYRNVHGEWPFHDPGGKEALALTCGHLDATSRYYPGLGIEARGMVEAGEFVYMDPKRSPDANGRTVILAERRLDEHGGRYFAIAAGVALYHSRDGRLADILGKPYPFGGN